MESQRLSSKYHADLASDFILRQSPTSLLGVFVAVVSEEGDGTIYSLVDHSMEIDNLVQLLNSAVETTIEERGIDETKH